MLIDSGRSPARDAITAWARRAAVTRLRAGSAGAVSAAAAVAAHGWVMGGMPPRSGQLALLVAACMLVGVAVAGLGPLRTTNTGLIGALLGGQLLGHIAMSVGSMGMPDHSPWTSAMIAAHTVAAVAAAVLIRGAEAACRIGTGVLARVLPVLLRGPAVAGPPIVRIAHRDRVVLRILAADTFRTRGPPAALAS